MFKNILLALLIISPVAANAEWEFYSQDSERFYYFNKDTVKVTNQYTKEISYWTKSIYHSDLQKDSIAVNDYYLTLYYGNCSDETLATKSLALYNKNGELRFQQTVPTEFKPVIPDSRGELLLRELCSYTFS
ncbi:surface-adhesin E family protein [Acinetobacter kanungonis]|uniref:surface-adhesin E family protein n=1 Tax=Acinetobacter kanungonis TaxID=2699469 RepID=UPI00137A34D7|nr:surface-adhesin E family protein [Acinetobacter kanungonis]NCI80105.1 hypothetical protein [Acinetobacter kanungonis]